MTTLYIHGQTVRFIGAGWTPSQRRTLWVVDLDGKPNNLDWGSANVKVHRQTDPDSIIWAPRYLITAATVLDLLADA